MHVHDMHLPQILVRQLIWFSNLDVLLHDCSLIAHSIGNMFTQSKIIRFITIMFMRNKLRIETMHRSIV